MQPSNTELILIRVTGEDRPGLTASVTEILAKYDATILDIGQADIHNTLSLGILFKSEERHSGFIMKELLFKASSLGVTSTHGAFCDGLYFVAYTGTDSQFVNHLCFD